MMCELGAISDVDVHRRGGRTLIRQFTLALYDLAKYGALDVAIVVGRQGKVYKPW